MIKWILIILLATVMFFGCGKESPSAPTPNQPPVITDTHCTIILYTSGYGPTGIIYCKVTDPDGLGDIDEVKWISDVQGYNPQITQLYDDGSHGDPTANDGTYSIDATNYTVWFYWGDGVHNGIGPVYTFEVEDKAGHSDDTDPIEY
ncbi:hypothetical protein KAU13_03075 [candidate division WOR-3 bacterium]|nr:hypothetical protein [candidate division WOR-3 bacterium]